ncbi:hypothetical protein ACHAWC_006343 [Mediolabrus comicus]
MQHVMCYVYKKYRRRGHNDATEVEAEGLNEENGKEGEEDDHKMTTNEYIFALVGYAIGIGNIWRFPYVIATNGGSAALLAYIICAIFVAWPMFTYELILGQHLRKSFIKAWNTVRPRWRGFGFAQLMLIFICNSYFSVVIAYTLPYIKASCITPLPWTVVGTKKYWEEDVLGKLPTPNLIKGLGGFEGEMLVALSVFWVIIFVSVAFGKNVLAKITYVTVTMPIVLMFVLLIVAVRQPGANLGIEFYIGKFDTGKLTEFSTWAAACSQILFSLGSGFGTAVTYSSFVDRKEDVYKASMIVCFMNSAFSIIGGFAVFSIIGWVAQRTGQTVEETASAVGPGLAFFTVAEAMGLFGDAQNVMSVLFYVMLFTLGLDSAYAWTETIVVAVKEELAKKGIKLIKWQLILILCVMMYLFGLVFVSRKGFEILDMIDMFVGTVFLLYLVFVETFIFNFDYGWRRLEAALKAATVGNKGTPNGRTVFPSWLCRIDFHGTVPLATGALFLYELINLGRNNYEGYPMSINGWGWFLLCLGIVISWTTIWKSAPGKLLPIEEDPAFQEIFSPEDKEVGNGDDDEVPEKLAGSGNDPGEDDDFADNELGADAGLRQPLDDADDVAKKQELVA